MVKSYTIMLKKTPRIIPRLDIKNNNLIKGANLDGLRILVIIEE